MKKHLYLAVFVVLSARVLNADGGYNGTICIQVTNPTVYYDYQVTSYDCGSWIGGAVSNGGANTQCWSGRQTVCTYMVSNYDCPGGANISSSYMLHDNETHTFTVSFLNPPSPPPPPAPPPPPPGCVPNCTCASNTPQGQTCPDGCPGGGRCAGTGCIVNCGCAVSTCQGTTCTDTCDHTTVCQGTRVCCTANCSCAAYTCTGNSCSDGCLGTCPGTNTCPCPNGTICGTVYAGENGTTVLPKVIVELRNSSGTIVQTQTTDINGTYAFTPPIALASYYVNVAAGRTQVSNPAQCTANPGNSCVFNLIGVSAVIHVTDIPGTFVVISSQSYVGAPPVIDQNKAATQSAAFSAVVGLTGIVDMNVPLGSYYITCWKPQASGSRVVYVSNGSGQISEGGTLQPLAPQSKTNLTCP